MKTVLALLLIAVLSGCASTLDVPPPMQYSKG